MESAIARIDSKVTAYCELITSKSAIISLAEQLDIPTTEDKYNKDGEVVGEKALNQAAIQDEILLNASPKWALFIDDAENWPVSLRRWMKLLERKGASLILSCTKRKRSDIFLARTEIELSKPDIYAIREVMKRHANRLNHPLTDTEIADLQQYAGSTFGTALRVVEQHQMGLKIKSHIHRDVIVTWKYVLGALSAIALVRYWGMIMGDRSLYGIGAMAFVAFGVLKVIGTEIIKPRKGLGQ